MNVDPLNPMGGFDWSNPAPVSPLVGATAPPATSPGQPVPRPATQPQAPGGAPPTATDPLNSLTDPAFLAAEYKKTEDKLAQLDTLLQNQRQSADTQGQAITASAGQPIQPPTLGTFDQQQPQMDISQFSRSAPLLAVLAALGGKMTKMSGLTMLKATNAMIAGGIAGNQEAYVNAKKVYDDEYQKFQDRERQKAVIYRDQMEARRDTLQEREAAWKVANAAVGDTLSQEKDLESKQHAILQTAAALKRQRMADAARMQGMKDVEKMIGLGETADKNLRSIEQSIPRIKMANDTVQKMKNDWPALMADLKKALGPNATAPVPIAELLKKYKDDPRVGEFVQRVNALKSALVVIESSGAGAIRSNQFIQQIFAKTAPDLFTSTAPQITEALRIDSKMIGDFYANQQQELSRQKARAEYIRQKIPGMTAGEEPTGGEDVFSQADAIIGQY